eukprot:scaffold31170_cov69-Cyclotella_meneghiniana.AAC.4
MTYLDLLGTVATVYGETTSVCGAARNEGLLTDATDATDALIDVTIVSEALVQSISNRSLHMSREYFFLSSSSRETRVQTIAGASGYNIDSFPPQSSKFRHPAGIGAFVNASIDDKSHFMFIADRDNNSIRGMSACEEGWSGIDCTRPVMKEKIVLKRNVYRAAKMADIVQLLIRVAVHQDGLIRIAPLLSANRHVATVEIAQAQIHVLAPQTGEATIVESLSVIRFVTITAAVLPLILVCAHQAGVATIVLSLYVIRVFSSLGIVYLKLASLWMLQIIGLSTVHATMLLGVTLQTGSIVHKGIILSQPRFHYMVKSGGQYILNDESFAVCMIHSSNSFLATRYKTGRRDRPNDCMMIELRGDAITHFQYLSAADNTSTPHYRYSPTLQYDWQSNVRLPWNAYSSPSANITQPYIFDTDRQVALVSAINVTQGRYMCANGGRCVNPDVCSCSKGWMGFDCRIPVCEQGYYEPELDSLVQGPKSDDDFAFFQPFLDPQAKYNLDSSRNFSSNHNIETWAEEFINASLLDRRLVVVNGSRYLSFDADGLKSQGGYECSIRSLTEWERPGFVLNHPNYYSRYMDQKVEADGEVYSRWKGMHYPPTHHKTAKLIKHGREYVTNSASVDKSFVYSDSGYMLDGIWLVTGANWEKGSCVVEFERRCEGAFDNIDPTDIADELNAVLVQDTDES